MAGFFLMAISAGSLTAQEKDPLQFQTVKRPSTKETNRFYKANKAPLAPLSFIKLPPGSIRPGGWIRKCLELERDGLAGHLGSISAWLDKKNNAWFSGNGQGDHGWEEVPYWLKGYAEMAYILKDERMLAETRSWLDKALMSQRADGYFGPAMGENGQPAKQGAIPDLWPNMIMLWCLQSWYEYSGDPRVIPFMTRYFQWESRVPEDKLLTTYWENSRGGDNLYSIYWLYNRTGDKQLLELAARIHRRTADWGRKDDLPNWHNVNVAQCFREPATWFMQSGDSAGLQATYNDFYLIRRRYGQVPGGMFGADENARPGYTDPRQAVETCGMVEQMASDELLTGMTGDPMWADNCEDVAFNTYPAALTADLKGLRYLTAPNMAMSDIRNHSPGIENEGPYLMMNPFSSRCCQHNHTQGWPYYNEHLWMATPDNGLAAILYNSCEVTAKTGRGESVTLTETTRYPFSDRILIVVSAAKPSEFPLWLRIPGWCAKASVKVNGQPVKAELEGASYARLMRKWKMGDSVELDLPMTPVIRNWPANKNSVSIYYGPLSFSLDIPEYYKRMDSRNSAISEARWQQGADPSQWPSYEIFPLANWNYGMVLNGRPAEQQFRVIRRPWPESDFPFTREGTPLMLEAKGRLIPFWTLDNHGLCDTLPPSPVSVNTPEQPIGLIPMGAARLRISAFPVVQPGSNEK